MKNWNDKALRTWKEWSTRNSSLLLNTPPLHLKHLISIRSHFPTSLRSHFPCNSVPLLAFASHLPLFTSYFTFDFLLLPHVASHLSHTFITSHFTCISPYFSVAASRFTYISPYFHLTDIPWLTSDSTWVAILVFWQWVILHQNWSIATLPFLFARDKISLVSSLNSGFYSRPRTIASHLTHNSFHLHLTLLAFHFLWIPWPLHHTSITV